MRALSQMTSAPAKLRNSFARTIVAAPGPSGVRAMHARDARATACRVVALCLSLSLSLSLALSGPHLDRASDLPTAIRYVRIPNTPSRDSARDDDDDDDDDVALRQTSYP